MNKCVYHFSYGNPFNFLLTMIIEILATFGLTMLVFAFSLLLFAKIEDYYLNYENIRELIIVVSLCLPTVFSAYFWVQLFIPKRVIVSDDLVIIKRHNFYPDWSWCCGFNDKIPVEKIAECKIYDGDRPILDRRNKPYTIVRFNWDNLVEITTDKRNYLVPVKNAEMFVEDVNRRMPE